MLSMILRNVGGFYRWLYYRCYRYSKKADFRFSKHWVNAATYLLMILITNVTVLFFALAFLGLRISMRVPAWTVGALLVGIALLQLAVLGHRGRYGEIINEFSKETVDQQRRGDLAFGWYLAFSLVSFIAVFVVATMHAGS